MLADPEGRPGDLIATGGSVAGRGATEADLRRGALASGQPALLGALRARDQSYRTRCCRRDTARVSRRALPWVGSGSSDRGSEDRHAHLRFLRTAEGRTDKFGFTPDRVAETVRRYLDDEAHATTARPPTGASGSTASPTRCWTTAPSGLHPQLSVTGLTSNRRSSTRAISAGDATTSRSESASRGSTGSSSSNSRWACRAAKLEGELARRSDGRLRLLGSHRCSPSRRGDDPAGRRPARPGR